MHTAFFGIKMVHWRVVGSTNRTIRAHGLTAARFDLMRIILLAPEEEGVAQGTLKWLLGVAAPTVSRMLKSLEALGHILRDRAVDRRCFNVRLTERGRVATRGCLAAAVDGDMAEWTAARGVLGETEQAKSSDERRDAIARGAVELGRLRGLLANLRTAFRDVAPFSHPWRVGNFLAPLVYATFDEHGEIAFKDAFTGESA